MKLLDIRTTPILVDPLDGEYYRLRKDAEITMVTDEGTYHDFLGAGWITDLRSGSSFIDHFIPKWDGPESPYSALIAFHDSCWSGWVPREISDETGVLSTEVPTLFSQNMYRVLSVKHEFTSGGKFTQRLTGALVVRGINKE